MNVFSKLLFATSILALLNSCNNNSKQSETDNSIQEELEDRAQRDSTVRAMPKTKVTVDEDMHDFGDVTEGEKVTHTFTLKNEGEHPFLISNVFTPCGCTVPSYSQKPVLPGTTATIDVEFNTANKTGLQEKYLDVSSNAEPAIKLGFKANVIEKK